MSQPTVLPRFGIVAFWLLWPLWLTPGRCDPTTPGPAVSVESDPATMETVYRIPEGALFRRFNREATIAGVEKVQIAKARELPYFAELEQRGVKAGERLPYDCLVWLAIAPTGAPDR